jgi:hypothetical protein
MIGVGSNPQADGEVLFFIDNLLVRIHLIIEMVLVDRPCAMEFECPFSGSLISAKQVETFTREEYFEPAPVDNGQSSPNSQISPPSARKVYAREREEKRERERGRKRDSALIFFSECAGNKNFRGVLSFPPTFLAGILLFSGGLWIR